MNESVYIKRFYQEYYGNKPKKTPSAPFTKALMIICILVYIFLPDSMYPLFMFKIENLSTMPWIIITNAFLHANLFHLFFNMLGLYMFGTLIEKRHGTTLTVITFLLSVVIGNIAFGLLNPDIYGLGISGYLYALIGAAVILEPDTRVLFPIGYIITTAPVKIAGPIMFFGELIYSIGSGDNIGHIAHAAGFLVGLAIAFIQKERIKSQWDHF